MKPFYRLLVLVSLIAILFSIRGVKSWYIDCKNTKKIDNYLKTTYKIEMTDIDNSVKNLYNPPIAKTDTYYKYIESPFIKIDISKLMLENKDTVGWIETGKISYPIVQTTDNEFYLNHDFYQKESKAGSLFVDYRNNIGLDENTVIYGHRRLDNTMFGPLINVLNKNYFEEEENNLIKLVTLNSTSVWQIISVYTIKKESYYLRTQFLSDDLYQEFLDTILKRSIIPFTDNLNINDKILTLSTCYDNYGKRIVVHARLIKKETIS